ncbi:unnamed protein product, partial [Musa hybrid cultivar]
TLAAFTRASWGRASDRRNNSTGTSDPFRFLTSTLAGHGGALFVVFPCG